MFAQQNIGDRLPVVAGKFYSSSEKGLKKDLKTLFDKSENKNIKNIKALISPHAGYVFSGEVAASAFKQIPRDKKYKRVFILASSHVMSFKGASIYNAGDYITPLGKVKVDKELIRDLFDDNTNLGFVRDAHISEHSIEVQLPFLQYWLNNEFTLIPIVLGTSNIDVCQSIAKSLKKYYNDENLFVVSTDFSHYPEYDDAVDVDGTTANAVVSGNPRLLLEVLAQNRNKHIDNLSTSMCGSSAVVTMMNIANSSDKYTQILYKNSGDNKFYGDKNGVVGYWSISVSDQPNRFELSDESRKELLDIARNSIIRFSKDKSRISIDSKDIPDDIKSKFGAFVSVYVKEELRGCIGRFSTSTPLWENVKNLAIAASSEDSRFSSVKEDELRDMKIEISVLSPLRKIDSIDEIEMGKHGIYIKKGYASGTFLPQVAKKTGWSKEEFLGYCSRDKARIGWSGWEEADVFVYEAVVFSDK